MSSKVFAGAAALAALATLCVPASAQIRVPGTPAASLDALPGPVPTLTVPVPDVAALELEDQRLDEAGVARPVRFGVPVPVSAGLDDSGRWDVSSSGELVWRLRFHAPGARSLGLEFSEYSMPAGAQLFVYDDQVQTVYGAYDAVQHNPDGTFVIEPFPGDTAVLEYKQPAGTTGVGAVRLQAVIYDYKDFFAMTGSANPLGSAGGSGGEDGGCSVGANCPQFSSFDPQKRATLRTIFGGGFCSASLINNTSNDGTQYVYTANHCGQGSSTVFSFNYQQSGCGAGSVPNQSVSGATFLTSNIASDGRLLRINPTIPASFSPFFNGWNRSATAIPSFGLSFTHPGGGFKSGSIDNNGLSKTTISVGGISQPVQSWAVGFSTGGISGGSSGGPMFDQNERTVGAATAVNLFNCASGFYGRFDRFWNLSNAPNFLDPGNTGAQVLDGFDPAGPPPPPPVCGASQYGTGLGGANIGTLSTPGTPTAGQNLTLNLSGFNGNATGMLIFSPTQVSTPFLGGTLLMDFNNPFQGGVLNVGITGGSGSLVLGMPNSPDLVAFGQAAVPDASQSQGWAFSNGLQLVICP